MRPLRRAGRRPESRTSGSCFSPGVCIGRGADQGKRGLPPCLGLLGALPGSGRLASSQGASEADETGPARRTDCRQAGPINATAMARFALPEGPQTCLPPPLPKTRDPGQGPTEDQCRLHWHLHDLWPELEIPGEAHDRIIWLGSDRPQASCAPSRASDPDRPRVGKRDPPPPRPRRQSPSKHCVPQASLPAPGWKLLIEP